MLLARLDEHVCIATGDLISKAAFTNIVIYQGQLHVKHWQLFEAVGSNVVIMNGTITTKMTISRNVEATPNSDTNTTQCNYNEMKYWQQQHKHHYWDR